MLTVLTARSEVTLRSDSFLEMASWERVSVTRTTSLSSLPMLLTRTNIPGYGLDPFTRSTPFRKQGSKVAV